MGSGDKLEQGERDEKGRRDGEVQVCFQDGEGEGERGREREIHRGVPSPPS